MPSGRERRREERRPASGLVRISFLDPAPHQVEGRLLDVSGSGFRALHSSSDLRLGQTVEFESRYASGRARVVWNRITPEGTESGFYVLD